MLKFRSHHVLSAPSVLRGFSLLAGKQHPAGGVEPVILPKIQFPKEIMEISGRYLDILWYSRILEHINNIQQSGYNDEEMFNLYQSVDPHWFPSTILYVAQRKMYLVFSPQVFAPELEEGSSKPEAWSTGQMITTSLRPHHRWLVRWIISKWL